MKLPNYVLYFGSNTVEGVAESWVEAEMSWVEVDGTGWRLKSSGWRRMELGGGGWSWVELGVRFSSTLWIIDFKTIPLSTNYFTFWNIICTFRKRLGFIWGCVFLMNKYPQLIIAKHNVLRHSFLLKICQNLTLYKTFV